MSSTPKASDAFAIGDTVRMKRSGTIKAWTGAATRPGARFADVSWGETWSTHHENELVRVDVPRSEAAFPGQCETTHGDQRCLLLGGHVTHHDFASDRVPRSADAQSLRCAECGTVTVPIPTCPGCGDEYVSERSEAAWTARQRRESPTPVDLSPLSPERLVRATEDVMRQKTSEVERAATDAGSIAAVDSAGAKAAGALPIARQRSSDEAGEARDWFTDRFVEAAERFVRRLPIVVDASVVPAVAGRVIKPEDLWWFVDTMIDEGIIPWPKAADSVGNAPESQEKTR